MKDLLDLVYDRARYDARIDYSANRCRVWGKIAPDREKALSVVDELLGRINDYLTGWQAAKCLGQIAPGNEKAIAAWSYL